MAKNSKGWDERLDGGAVNAFDAIRLILASLVVLEHSYFLIDNHYRRDPLFLISGGQLNCGQLAVYMFFALSGFLVTRSLMQSRSIVAFMARRIGRIVPGFIVASAVGCLIVGPLTTVDPAQYFRSQNWPLQILRTLTLNQIAVSDVLAGNAVTLVHGTLWSIKYEFDCYMWLALFGTLGLFRPRIVIATFIAISVAFGAAILAKYEPPVIDHGIMAFLVSSPHRWLDLMPYFIAGSAFYVFRAAIPKSMAWFAAAVIAWFASLTAGGAYVTTLLCGTYAILYMSLSQAGDIKVLGERVDLSYGVYLYGWPVQQLILYWTHTTLSPVVLFAISMVVTAIVAYLSWRFVEHPGLLLARNWDGIKVQRVGATRRTRP